jgi:hypothetical protein
VHNCERDFGLRLSANNERSSKLRMAEDHRVNNVSGGLYMHRAARAWNALPAELSQTVSLAKFKTLLHTYLMQHNWDDNYLFT